MKPYKDKNNIREFSKNINSNKLIWHKDKNNRLVEVLEGKGWKFQLDNELPFELKENNIIFIPKDKIHRLIKGNTNLKIKIEEQ